MMNQPPGFWLHGASPVGVISYSEEERPCRMRPGSLQTRTPVIGLMPGLESVHFRGGKTRSQAKGYNHCVFLLPVRGRVI
jgi:hypothetical protein